MPQVNVSRENWGSITIWLALYLDVTDAVLTYDWCVVACLIADEELEDGAPERGTRECINLWTIALLPPIAIALLVPFWMKFFLLSVAAQAQHRATRWWYFFEGQSLPNHILLMRRLVAFSQHLTLYTHNILFTAWTLYSYRELLTSLKLYLVPG